MEFTYKQRYVLYLIIIPLAVVILLGKFEVITNFRLENMPFISVRNLVGILFFYLTNQIRRHQADYY